MEVLAASQRWRTGSSSLECGRCYYHPGTWLSYLTPAGLWGRALEKAGAPQNRSALPELTHQAVRPSLCLGWPGLSNGVNERDLLWEEQGGDSWS